MTPVTEQVSAGRPAAPASAPAALLFATAPAAGGGCAALLPIAGQTLAGRLLDQLARLGVTRTHVLTRPQWERDVASALPGSVIRTARTLADELATTAELAEREAGTLVLLAADVAMHGEALAGLLEDPRLATGALTAREGAAAEAPFGVEIRRMRVIDAESPFHAVPAPTARFLEVVKVAGGDRATLAGAASELAALVAERPDGWDAELERKAAAWAEPARVAAARGDAVALLLVGLTRAGAPVGISRLRELVWSRPLSEAAADDALGRIERTDEDRLRLDSAVKSTDGLFTTLFVSPYSRHLARFAARRGLTPNQVTTASMLTGLAAAALFATGERWGLVAGAVLLQAAFTLDCVDGQLARYTRRFSRFGAWLDSIFDRAKEYAAYAGLAIGASHMGDPVWVLAGAALAVQTLRHLTDASFAVRRLPDPVVQPPLAAVGTPPGVAGRVPAPAQDGVVARSRRLDAVPVALWAKKLIGFPIGERFAVISLTAALFTPRVTFVVLLAWGGFAGLYGLAGRVARTIGARRAAPVPEREGLLRLYRDDGLLATALGAVAAPGVRRIPPALLVVAGILPALVLIAASGAGTSRAAALAALAWMVVLGGASAGASHAGPAAWAAPPAIRLGEYAGLLWIAAIAGAEPAALALLGALAFRVYDLIYRPKYQGRAPARWVQAIALGWDGRLVLAGVLLVAGALEAGFFAWAAVIGVAFAGEAAMSWRRAAAGPGSMTDDEEDEGP